MRRFDKVVLLGGPYAGRRGTITLVRGRAGVTVQLGDGGPSIDVRADDIRNFSAAARKAWKTSPSRRVGRPAGKSLNRISVTLRIDVNLWQRFLSLESRELVNSRSGFIELALVHAIKRTEKQAR
jgi:hypothetical protein